MTADLAHFAINADDVEGTRRFYEAVLGWTFEAWGPPDFYKIETGSGNVLAALQHRRELIEGTKTVGFECTFAVDDVDDVARRVEEAGGRILMAKTTITGVGALIWFEDPAGNAAGAMQYEVGVR